MIYELCTQISTDKMQFIKTKKGCLYKTEHEQPRISALLISLCCKPTWETHFDICWLDAKNNNNREAGKSCLLPHTRSRASNI